jgi:Glycosyl hydrolase family 26
MTGDHGLSIMKPPRTTARIHVRAILVMAGIAVVTAACSSGGGGASTQATSSWGGSNASPGSAGGASLATNAAGLGIYDGKSEPAGIETAANWLGSPNSIKYAMDFIDATDWDHISNPWQLDRWKGTSYQMIWGVPMVPCGGPSTQCATDVDAYNQVAQGGAGDTYKTLAQNLISAGFGSSYIRLGWEFNASWMGWSVCNQSGSGLTSWAGDFVPAFRNIVTAMRSVSGAKFKFIWNPIVSSSASCPNGNLEKFYPGDKYVDVVSLDVYDEVGQQTSNNARWSDLVDGVNGGQWTSVKPDDINGQSFKGYGLTWLAAFGKEYGKLISLPEWGLESTDQQSGGGDDAYFVTKMADWIKATATGPAIFWNSGGGTLPLTIPNYTNGHTPDATAAFKAAFSTGG